MLEGRFGVQGASEQHRACFLQFKHRETLIKSELKNKIIDHTLPSIHTENSMDLWGFGVLGFWGFGA